MVLYERQRKIIVVGVISLKPDWLLFLTLHHFLFLQISGDLLTSVLILHLLFPQFCFLLLNLQICLTEQTKETDERNRERERQRGPHRDR